tara:strand:- start:14028 stop:15113 length:1086 start_codon:yes stop_codon:yes gene_type:complete
MSKDSPQPQQSEEIDLGQLFKVIGNAFDRLFLFIASIFVAIYDVFLLLLIHIFKRLKWYVGVVILGIVIGAIIDKMSPYLYGANMQIETKYNSSRQVYENINFLNQLAAIDRDSVELSNRLGISESEAASIVGFSIQPNIDENDKMKLFSDFRAQLDSLTKNSFTYKDYVEGLSSYSFGTHQIEVISTNKSIFSKMNDSLVKELADNPYLNEIKKVTLENLDLKAKALEEQKETLDSLKTTYLSIRKSESEKQAIKPGTGTNLIFGANQQQQSLIVDETKLVERQMDLINQKLDIYKSLISNKYVVNIISEFPAAGYDIGKLFDKAKVRVPLLFVLITLIFFIALGLKKYVEKEEKRLFHK